METTANVLATELEFNKARRREITDSITGYIKRHTESNVNATVAKLLYSGFHQRGTVTVPLAVAQKTLDLFEDGDFLIVSCRFIRYP